MSSTSSLILPNVQSLSGISYDVSIDFGTASSFITGTYPNLYISPSASSADPGTYNIQVSLIYQTTSL